MTCGAKTKSGSPCELPAGWGTDHKGEGKCKLHGGKSNGAPIKHGRYSIKSTGVQSKIKEYREDPTRGELWDELALQRALLQNYLERNDEMDAEHTERVFDLTESIARTLDRINKIMTRTALTQAEVQYLQARFADILTKYVPKEKRHKAVKELNEAVGAA